MENEPSFSPPASRASRSPKKYSHTCQLRQLHLSPGSPSGAIRGQASVFGAVGQILAGVAFHLRVDGDVAFFAQIGFGFVLALLDPRGGDDMLVVGDAE